MSETSAGHRHRVIVAGDGAAGLCAGTELIAAGVSDFVILEQPPGINRTCPPALDGHLRFDREVTSSTFDDDTHTWTVITRGGEMYLGQVVIAASGRSLTPWIPDIAGNNDFQGVSFHAAAADPDFDPRGKRVAVIGADTTAGQVMRTLTDSAESVSVFGYPPRRAIPRTHRRRVPSRLSRHGRAPQLVRAPIDALTASGVRTTDGVDHDVDAIIYATGFAAPERVCGQTLIGAGGLTIEQAWQDGMEPYCGVAVHGFPNYFLLTRPDIPAQVRYVAECLQLMTRTASTRIQVRRSSQQVFNERMHLRRGTPHPMRSAFDLSSDTDAGTPVHDGAATLTLADTRQEVHVRLTGHVDPIDGKYHWRGMIFDSLPTDVLARTRAVTLTVDGQAVAARISDNTPWGGHSVAGTSVPPFALDDAAAVPQERR